MRVLTLLLGALVVFASPASAAPDRQALVRAAIVDAVVARLAGDVDVAVDELRIVTAVPVGRDNSSPNRSRAARWGRERASPCA